MKVMKLASGVLADFDLSWLVLLGSRTPVSIERVGIYVAVLSEPGHPHNTDRASQAVRTGRPRSQRERG
jgi:hypothetical protein